jgi:ribonuclease HI
MQKLSHIKIFTDGGSRGNPGPAASGVYISDQEGNAIGGFGTRLGIQTNNFAEYTAVIEALQWVIDHREDFSENLTINFFMDSLLVYSQISRLWKVKNEAIGNLLGILREKQGRVTAKITYAHVPREKNKDADRYVNLTLDNKI